MGTMGGQTTIRRGAGDEASPPSLPTLRVLYTSGQVVTAGAQRLAEGETTLGRLDGATFAFPADGQVSRLHATIHVEHGALRIVDKSTNGTWVNGTRVRVEHAALSDNDVVRIGDTLLHVRFVADDSVMVPEASIGSGLIGDAPSMHEVRHTLSLVGPTDATVLVTGPSGTGKEVVARALHRLGRPKGPFVAVNCSAIPETLAESQLFGHVAGAFTGAKSDQPGFFRAANKGVVFLDEIGELPLSLQAKLLRALEERMVIPVGSVTPVPFDARVVAATNRRLAFEVAESRFRGDLLARITEIEVTMPSLASRAEDVLPLVTHALGPAAPPLSPDLAEALVRYPWPYNVRELFKVAAELTIRGAGAKVLEHRLVADRLKRESLPAPRPSISPVSLSVPPAVNATPSSKEEKAMPIPTKEELVAMLHANGGSVAEVARATGRSRKQVYRWIASHGIDVDSFRDES